MNVTNNVYFTLERCLSKSVISSISRNHLKGTSSFYDFGKKKQDFHESFIFLKLKSLGELGSKATTSH